MESLNERLKKKRNELGLSQTFVAELAGITQSAYAQIENGNTKSITIEAGKGIAKALNVPFSELFEIEHSELTGHVLSENEKDQFKILVFRAIEEYVSMQVLIKSGYFNEENNADQKQFEEFRFNLHAFQAGVYASLVAKGFCTAKEISVYRDYINPNKRSNSK